jgi:sugar lactone lactonase YvrE
MKNLTCLVNWTIMALALTAFQSPAQTVYEPYTFSTLAGGGGFATNMLGGAVRFWNPIAVSVHADGNVYVADQGNNSISKVTPAGAVTVLAGQPGTVGSANGTGSAARFNLPSGTAVDNAGNVFVSDTWNNTIRKVTPAGVVTTLAGQAGTVGSADGTGAAARFSHPFGIAIDSGGNVYVTDAFNHTIRKVTPAGVVTTLAGLAGSPGSVNATGSTARFNGPYGLAVDGATNVYVADTLNHTIRKMTLVGANWVVTTLAGLGGSSGDADGTNSTARFNEPNSVTVDSEGNLYVADYWNNTIRKMTLHGTNWVVTTVAGLAGSAGSADGTNSAGRFNIPASVATDTFGNLYVADAANNLIRKMTLAGTNWIVTTLAGLGGVFGSANGTGTAARFYGPSGVGVDSSTLYVADQINHTIQMVSPGRGIVSTFAGLPGSGGSADGTGNEARFRNPSGVAVDSKGMVYVADTWNCTIRQVTPAGVVTTLAGLPGIAGADDGTNSQARFIYPQGLAVDKAGNLYVADTGAGTIRKMRPVGTNWVVTTLAGRAYIYGSQNGTGSAAQFNLPTGVAVDSAGNLFVADILNQLIRKVTPAGVVTTFAGAAGVAGGTDGTGTAARFYAPSGVAVDGADNLYVADAYNNTIRKVTPARVVTTLAGSPGDIGAANGIGDGVRFGNPAGLAVDSAGNVYVADFYFNTIRKGYPPPRILNSAFNEGQFGFDLTGPPGHSVVVDASTDLANWLPLWTNTFAGPLLNFTDSQSGVHSNRFYRVRAQ